MKEKGVHSIHLPISGKPPVTVVIFPLLSLVFLTPLKKGVWDIDDDSTP